MPEEQIIAVLSEIRLRYDFARDAWTAVLEGIRSNARDSVRHQRIFVAKFRVDDKRLQTTSRGEIDATGKDEGGWAEDRRVDIQLSN